MMNFLSEKDTAELRSAVIHPNEISFETVLDTACERLREKHIEFSIRRIGELEADLDRLEKELDEYIRRFAH